MPAGIPLFIAALVALAIAVAAARAFAGALLLLGLALKLATIFLRRAGGEGFYLDPDAQDAAALACVRLDAERGAQFGNARAVRTLWERAREAQAVRLAAKGGASDRHASLSIDASDILVAEARTAPGGGS